MDRIERYRIFMQVAELGSFIGAANALSLPRATVSAAIQQLESSLGTRLFHRTTRHVQLTADGGLLLEQARQIVTDVDGLESQFRDRQMHVSGRLVIDAPSRIVRRLIVPNLDNLFTRHPALEVFLGSTDRFVDLVQDGVDCAIRVGVLRSSSLVVRRLGALESINCASPHYLKEYGVPDHPDHLARSHHIVSYSVDTGTKPPGGNWEYVATNGLLQEIDVPARVIVNNAENYIACCLAGLGLIQVPRFDVQHLIDQGRLVEVMPDHRAPASPISLVYSHRRQRSRRVMAFAAWFDDLIRSHLMEETAGSANQRAE